MLLTVDLGNTNITFGLYPSARPTDGPAVVDVPTHSWRLETSLTRTEDEYGLLLRQLLHTAAVGPESVTGAIIASVVPVLTPTLVKLCRRLFGRPPLVVGPGLRTGVSVRYDPAKDVGADRIVNAVAAHARFRSACIVVDFGTATTLDSVLEDGTYAGGAIAPGIELSMSALFSRAAKLPKVDFARPERTVGRAIAESIQSGVFFGYVSLVDGLVLRFQQEMSGGPEVPVIATGGLAESIAADSQTITAVDEFLTLDGLRRIYWLNVGGRGSKL